MSDEGWGDDGELWSDPGSWLVETEEEERLRRDALAEMKSLEILAKDLKEFYLSKELSDVQIKCGDQTFDAHQFILSARSPVFRRMLQTEMKEKKTGVVNLEGTSPEVVSELLKFIYTGSCCVNDDFSMLCELLEAADKYELENLKDVLALSSKITLVNSLQVDKYFLENTLTIDELTNFFSILPWEICMRLRGLRSAPWPLW